MSLELLRPFFREHLNSLKLKEWKDAFNYSNIPSTVLNKSYHIETPTGGRRGIYTNLSQPIEHDVVIRVFFKGYRYPAEAVDQAMTMYNLILRTVLASENRLGAGIKNIYLNDVSIDPYDASNDNLVLLEITFTCLMEICT
jgi:hypothetical protein